MRVGIIGAGFVGLSAALKLAQHGVDVEIIESSDKVGGLAAGFSLPGWDWPVEKFYHHIFANDEAIIQLSKRVGHAPVFFRPITAIYVEREIHPFDSAVDLLRFPHLSPLNKLRMGATLGFLKVNPIWKPLERLSAQDFLVKMMGVTGYTKIWKPLLYGKFGPYAAEVNAAWFWARIKKRTSRLGYFNKGFQGLAERIKSLIIGKGGSFKFNCLVRSIEKKYQKFELSSNKGKHSYDSILVTTNNSLFLRMVKGIPDSYRESLTRIRSLDVLVVLLVLKKRLMENVYWLNVTDKKQPFVGIMEHTNMIDAKHYAGQHIIYLSTYLPNEHKLLKLDDKRLVDLALDQLERMSIKVIKRNIVETFVFRGKNAQPVATVNYSSKVPAIETPIENLYLANLAMVYPWDRGTNYAVELGEKAAKIIMQK